MPGRPRKVALTPLQGVVMDYLIEFGEEGLLQLAIQVHHRVQDLQLDDLVVALVGLERLNALVVDHPTSSNLALLARHLIWDPTAPSTERSARW